MSANDEWTTVSDGTAEQTPETKIVFEEIGDEFIGEFLGYRNLTDRDSGQSYTQARFRDVETNEICYTRANHSMREGLDKVSIGALTRIVYVDDTDTGMPSPMRTFTVQMKGRPSATTNAANASTTTRPVRRASARTAKAKPQGEKA